MVTVDREATARFLGHETWFRILGEVPGDPDGPAPLVTVHGGPGGTHDYLLSLSDLASGGRAVVFYDQLGNGNSTHLAEAPSEFWTFELFLAELDNLLAHLDIASRYHLLGQSWGGFLGLEHAVRHPPGLLSLVLSNTAASYPDWASETGRLRADLPAEVEETLRSCEAAGTTDSPEYREACDVFNRRHLCRLDPWPAEVTRSMELVEADPTVYRTMNGPSEFHITGTAKNWTVVDRLHLVEVPSLVLSGRYDEATPELQRPLVDRIGQVEQIVFEDSSHQPFWEERDRYMAVVGDWLARHD